MPKPSSWLKWGGPITLGAFLILTTMDLITMFFYSEMAYGFDDYYVYVPIYNVANTTWTLAMGIWLTVAGQRKRTNTSGLLIWIILDSLLLANQLAAIIWYMIIEISVPTLYAFQICWGKSH